MMNNSRYTKAQRRILRDLAGEAYRLELEAELDKLFADFQSWKSGEIDVWDLEEAVHKFHQGPSRELYSAYNDAEVDLMVAGALKKGILSKDHFPPDLLKEILEIIDVFNR